MPTPLKYGERLKKKDPPAKSKDGLYYQIKDKMTINGHPQGSMTCLNGRPLETDIYQEKNIERIRLLAVLCLKYSEVGMPDPFWVDIQNLCQLWQAKTM